jgi:hypothetical protein
VDGPYSEIGQDEGRQENNQEEGGEEFSVLKKDQPEVAQHQTQRIGFSAI